MDGILVGCNQFQEWILPWWWEHYAKYNSYCVSFVDFGLSDKMRIWCRERGDLCELHDSMKTIRLTKKEELLPNLSKQWELRYGKNIWHVRESWIKKAFSILHSPYDRTIWLDNDCKVLGNLSEIFSILDQTDLAVARDWYQSNPLLYQDEIEYNSGVLAFRTPSSFLKDYFQTIESYEKELPGDQELLSRCIHLTRPKFIELSGLYNWRHDLELNAFTKIQHFCGGSGKIAILKSLDRNR